MKGSVWSLKATPTRSVKGEWSPLFIPSICLHMRKRNISSMTSYMRWIESFRDSDEGSEQTNEPLQSAETTISANLAIFWKSQRNLGLSRNNSISEWPVYEMTDSMKQSGCAIQIQNLFICLQMQTLRGMNLRFGITISYCMELTVSNSWCESVDSRC